MEQSEAELERFRREWREEVSKKAKDQPETVSQRQPRQAAGSSSDKRHVTKKPEPLTILRHSERQIHDGGSEIEPKTYHDLEEKITGRRLTNEPLSPIASEKEPSTALEHYEKAVEKEGQGSLGDSVSLYRKAFRLDPRVQDKYKSKHFPTAAVQPVPKPINPNPPDDAVTVPSTAHHSLASTATSISDLILQFSQAKITAETPPTEFSESLPCFISMLPEEILTEILLYIAEDDIATLASLSQVCKRLAFLVVSEDSVWRRAALGHTFGFPAMLYQYACDIKGKPIEPSSNGEGNYSLEAVSGVLEVPERSFLPLTPIYPSYRRMLEKRPRVRFNGCYISTVNYTRPGATTSNWTWNTPVLIVTYFRYLRFFRDGTVISLLTTSEPQNTVPHLRKEHLHGNHTGNLPQSVMRDALRGRWRLSGDPFQEKSQIPKSLVGEEAALAEVEDEGDLHIETEGVVPKYIYKLHLGLNNAGRGARNNKLAWKGYWSHNRLTDDWAEFGLKNDRAFHWSRVRSYDPWE